MRRLRPLRRRAQQREREAMSPLEPRQDDVAAGGDDVPFAPFVPVSGPYELEEGETVTETVDIPERRPRRGLPRPRLPRPSFGLQVNVGVLLIAVILTATGIFGTLLNLGRLRHDVEAWWPLAVIVGAGLWMLVALLRRRVASFLGSAVFVGLGLSLLMNTQDIAAFDETVMGVILVAVGLGIVIRGFWLRQQAPA